jgi:hypothetical protein
MRRFVVLFASLMVAAVAAGCRSRPPTRQEMRAAARASREQLRQRKAATWPSSVVLAGRVLQPDGSPAPHARLYVSRPNEQDRFDQLAADERGHFHRRLRLGREAAGRLVVTAMVPGQAIAWRAFRQHDRRRLAALELRLQPGVTLTGRALRPDGSPAAGALVIGQSLEVDMPPAVYPYSGSERLLPDATVAHFERGRTDSAGRFAIAGLPSQGRISLAPGEGLVLAPGSTGPVQLLAAAGGQDIGILVVSPTGRIRVHVTDRTSGRPAGGVGVLVARVEPLVTSSSRLGCDGNPVNRVDTDEKGNGELSNLLPGEYWMVAQGRYQKVLVEEGGTAGPLEIRVRTGPVRGRVLDASGKPAARVRVQVRAEPPPGLDAQTAASLSSQSSTGELEHHGAIPFDVPEFAWQSHLVTVRATRVNEMAEWTGPGEHLGAMLELRLQPGALVSVAGRLLDPRRRPVAGSTFQAIRWQDGPRLAWFASAIQGQTDTKGCFRLDGLARGESFSLIAGQFGDCGPRQASFESPRFVTRTAGERQELGDVVVHPLDGPGQLFQLYGVDSPEQFARLFALLPLPSTDAAGGARHALERYLAALAAGDVDALHRLTARAALNWTEDRRDFLLRSGLRRVPSDERAAARVRCLRFVPQLTVALLLGVKNAQPQAGPGLDLGAGLREAAANPDWVFLAAPGRDRALTAAPNGIGLAVILHREEGEWRVVALSDQASSQAGTLLDLGTGVELRAADFGRPAGVPCPAQREAAQAAGERYLNAWAQDSTITMQQLTSPLSSGYARKLGDFRRRHARRLDEGACPLSGVVGSGLELKPVEDLTVWEAGWLATYIEVTSQLAGTANRPAGTRLPRDFPRGPARRGDLTAFRYRAGGQGFLMLLARYKGKWQVLEPALPM